MPVIILGYKKNAPSTIVSIVPFQRLISICGGSETLTAVVVGDLTGHTVLWEQLTGIPVTWTSPLNQLIVTFTTNSFTDKTFRFWIDKTGTNPQFEDLELLATPTDTASIGTADRNCIASYGIPLGCRKVTAKLFNKLTSGAGCGSANYSIVWNEPTCDADRIDSYIVEEFDGSSWVQVATIPRYDINGDLNQRIYLNPTADTSYRIITRYIDFSLVSTYISNSVFTNSTPSGAASAGEIASLGSASNLPAITAYSVNSISLLKRSVTDTTSLGTGSKLPTITSYSFSPLFVIGRTVTDSSAVGAMADGVIITGYTVLDLSGGGIGGP